MPPNPFSTKSTGGGDSGSKATSENILSVENSSLFCESCMYENTTGTYDKARKVLTWECYHCGKVNIVKEIELSD